MRKYFLRFWYHLRMICNRLYDIGAGMEWPDRDCDCEHEDYVDGQEVVCKSTRTTQSVISYAYEKYQEVNGVMY
jgi:hypothetical protein